MTGTESLGCSSTTRGNRQLRLFVNGCMCMWSLGCCQVFAAVPEGSTSPVSLCQNRLTTWGFKHMTISFRFTKTKGWEWVSCQV